MLTSWSQSEFSPWRMLHESVQQVGVGQTVKRLLLFLGPAFLISVGYMDPGNWGTDIEAGSRFGYSLLWVILISNLMALLLQMLSAKLGLATGRSLPEICRMRYPVALTVGLWVTAELASIATDLAEVLGGAVAFQMLFGIPLFWGALLTGGLVALILFFEERSLRQVELVIIGLVAVIGLAYLVEIVLARPDLAEIGNHMVVPHLPGGSLLVAVGIIGATVMPHNLYLHSALVQSRRRGDDATANRRALTLTIVDLFVALNGAWLVNSAILIMAAAVFYTHGLSVLTLDQAHTTLTPLLGPLSAGAFAIALLASGISSSTTATMAGQVVMQGFVHRHINVWLRRAITLVPALVVIALGIDPLQILVVSQVSLSFQLPFAMIPLILFTRNRALMGDFVNRRRTTALAWLSASVIIALNLVLVYQTLAGGWG